MAFPRIIFNAPVILSFCFLSLLVMFVCLLAPDLAYWLAASGPVEFRITYFTGLFTYPLVHGDWVHFFGNFSIILLVGPILEEKYGGQFIAFSFLITTAIIGFAHTLFFSGGIIGASGLVFFCIMLVSMTNFKRGQLPLTLILVGLLYLGKEVAGLFQDDQISQLGHILGGVLGVFVGLFLGNQTRG